MASNKDDAGGGAGRPAEPSAKRPYATIDVKATELGDGSAARGTAGARAGGRTGWMRGGAAVRARVARNVAAFQRLARRRWLTHAAAALAGALIVTMLAAWFAARWSAPTAHGTVLGSELARRIGDLEAALAQRTSAPASNSARLDELSRAVAALGDAQASLSREGKALAARSGAGAQIPAELQQRLARLEEAVAASGTRPVAANGELLARLTELEGSVRQTSEAVTAALARFDAGSAAARAETGRLADRLGALKQETEQQLQGLARSADVAPLAAKVAAVQQQLQAIEGSDAQRTAQASRLILTLELADVKRAADRGEGFSAELAQLNKTAGNGLDVAPLERYMAEGAPTVQDLATSFHGVANAMLDVEETPPDASVWGRLLAGARSIVRVRRIGHASGDTSTEAVIERMEQALGQGRLADAVGYADSLPPKAAGAAADWLEKARARVAIDRALAAIEAALKDSLAGRSARDAGR